MINLYKDIPYESETMGKRFLVMRDDLRIVQVALKAGQSIPEHVTDGNVSILVLKGELNIFASGKSEPAAEGSFTGIQSDTKMRVSNNSVNDATFMIIKTPKPGTKLQI